MSLLLDVVIIIIIIIIISSSSSSNNIISIIIIITTTATIACGRIAAELVHLPALLVPAHGAAVQVVLAAEVLRQLVRLAFERELKGVPRKGGLNIGQHEGSNM